MQTAVLKTEPLSTSYFSFSSARLCGTLIIWLQVPVINYNNDPILAPIARLLQVDYY